jgi:uncharacterized membrane protein
MSLAHGSKKESLAKTATWYLSDLLLTGIIAFAVTRDVTTSLIIAGLQQTWEVLLYYFHERIWVKLQARRGAENADGSVF